MMDTKKAPREAATSQGADKKEQIQKQNTTELPKKQGDFPAAAVLDDVGTRLGMAISLCGLLAEGLEEEVPSDSSPALVLGNRVEYYTDSLLVLREFLQDLQKEANGVHL